jgi:hypothetical protein
MFSASCPPLCVSNETGGCSFRSHKGNGCDLHVRPDADTVVDMMPGLKYCSLESDFVSTHSE